MESVPELATECFVLDKVDTMYDKRNLERCHTEPSQLRFSGRNTLIKQQRAGSGQDIAYPRDTVNSSGNGLMGEPVDSWHTEWPTSCSWDLSPMGCWSAIGATTPRASDRTTCFLVRIVRTWLMPNRRAVLWAGGRNTLIAAIAVIRGTRQIPAGTVAIGSVVLVNA